MKPTNRRIVRKIAGSVVALLLILSAIPRGSQTAEIGDEEFVEKLKGNVVRVDTTFQQSKDQKHGFGVIVGIKNDQLLIVTANHVARSYNPADGSPESVITFFNSIRRTAVLLKQHNVDPYDIAVLQVPKPENFTWIAESAAPASEISRGRDVWFIG